MFKDKVFNLANNNNNKVIYRTMVAATMVFLSRHHPRAETTYKQTRIT